MYQENNKTSTDPSVIVWDAGNGDNAPFDRYLAIFPDGSSYRITPDGEVCRYEGRNIKPEKTDVPVSEIPKEVAYRIRELMV